METRYLDKIQDLTNKLVVVTGANSGIGFETTLALARKHASVIMACRNLTKANQAKEKILELVEDAKLTIVQYDQGDLESIEHFCDVLKTSYQIDYLICNAGVYYPKKDYKTKDGFELTLGTNYIGVFYLVEHLKDYLESQEARVIITTSLTGFLAKKTYSLEESEKLNRNDIYGYSKYLLSRYTYELIKNEKKAHYFLVHPGVCQTNIISSEQTGLPNWFSKLGHYFLYLFVHHASKACLVSLEALRTCGRRRSFPSSHGTGRCGCF